MEPIHAGKVQEALGRFVGQDVYLHLETTTGAYAAEGLQGAPKTMTVCAFIRNAQVRFDRAVLTGAGPFRAGLEMENGWIYAEGLTDYELTPEGQLLLAGHDPQGRLAIALQLSMTPFSK